MKIQSTIERDMAFILSKDLKKSLSTDSAISSLVKARSLLNNAGLFNYCSLIDDIINKAQTIDDGVIEVTL
jgi:hypothetical protein